MKPSVKPAAHLRVEWLPTMPWNECPPSRGFDAHLPWNAQVKGGFISYFFVAAAAELALNRKLSLPVSRMWQRWVRRSSKAVVIFASPKTVAHSLKLRLVVMTTLVRS